MRETLSQRFCVPFSAHTWVYHFNQTVTVPSIITFNMPAKQKWSIRIIQGKPYAYVNNMRHSKNDKVFLDIQCADVEEFRGKMAIKVQSYNCFHFGIRGLILIARIRIHNNKT